MGRFSLSPPRLEGDQASMSREMPYREQGYDYYSDNDSQSSASDTSSDEEEEPHPLGFGKTRFSLSPPPKHFQSPSRFVFVDSDDEMEDATWVATRDSAPEQSFPPLSSYISPYTAPTASLVRYSLRGQHDDGDSDRMDKLTHLLEAACVVQHDAKQWLTPTTKYRSEQQDVGRKMWDVSNSMNRDFLELKERAKKDRRRVDDENRAVADALMMLLKRDQEDAQKILVREEKEEEKRQEEERQRQEEQEKEAAAQQKLIERQQQERKDKEEQAKQLEEKERQKQKAAKEAERARRKKEAEAEAQKTEYVARAKKLVAKLVELRKTVEPFEKLRVPQVSKRRLNMKKTVRGKLNTLSHDAGKVQAIAAEVSSTIREARTQDDQIKQMIQSGAGGEFTSEMARGKRYLLDLLASNVIVRIQAESFRGLKGDGFPLAAMLAEVSVDAKELVAILAAHIFTVCPMAIPTLPRPAPDCSEKELAESLGMGENESFERFLSRTEGTISMIADIMASKPPNHGLLGGHKGAVEWLERFIALLPPAPDAPLPLLTAPVLDAFLTGAGHMLANKYPEQFKKHLDVIMSDTIKRLDEGTIGQPSATRLKKLVAGGFDSFKNTLPEGAIPELYDGSGVSDTGAPSISSGFRGNIGYSTSPAKSYAANSPFGASQGPGATGSGFPASNTASSTANTFVLSTPAVSQSNPFGGSSGSTSTSNVFRQSQSAVANQSSSSSTGPFGQTHSASQLGGPSPFGAPNPDNASNDMAVSTPLGSSNTASFGSTSQSGGAFGASGTGSTSFGMSSSNPSPFGGGGAATSTPSPFGGRGATTSNQSPFGGGGAATSNPSPFGGGGATTSNAPFGSSNSPSPFGGGTASQPTSSVGVAPFGGSSSSPSPFGSGGATQPFGSAGGTSSSNAFGSASNNNTFSGTTPFGNASSSTSSFGGGSSGMQSTPFGSSGSQQSLFGGGTQSSAFGSSSNMTSASFGGSQQTKPFGSNTYGGAKKNIPCKFFAQGRCRNGANCKFSHETGGGSNSGGFGGNGGGSNPFRGGAGTPTPFGAGASSNPFGAPRR